MVEENREIYSTPVAAFVTFNTQEGYERCLQEFETSHTMFGYPIYHRHMRGALKNSNGFKLFEDEEDLEVFPAKEPSNIIWENLQIDNK